MELHLRVKRFKTTVFLEFTPKDKVEDLRRKLSVALKEDVGRLRLVGEDSNPFPENRTVAELGLQNDAVIYVVYPLEGGLGWEKVNIPPPEVIEDEEDDDEDGDG